MLHKFNFCFVQLFAAVTHVRFVQAMNGSHVRLQVWQLRKGRIRIGANGALERLLAGMLANVQLQHARMAKSSPANL